jgi:hypothetical protein
MPDKDRIEVHADGRIIHTAKDSTEAYETETDISGTRLGALLRGVLLEAASKSLPSQERPLNLSTKSEYKSESELSTNASESDNSLLRQEVKTQLLSAGIPAEEIEFFCTVSIYVKYLNNSRNPVKTAQTFRAKDSYPERFSSWSKRRKHNPVPQTPSEPPADNPKVFQINEDEVELPKSKAFEIED